MGGSYGAGASRREAPLTHDIAVASRRRALSHDDPANRILAATALVLGLTLVTADARLTGSAEYAVMSNEWSARPSA